MAAKLALDVGGIYCCSEVSIGADETLAELDTGVRLNALADGSPNRYRLGSRYSAVQLAALEFVELHWCQTQTKGSVLLMPNHYS